MISTVDARRNSDEYSTDDNLVAYWKFDDDITDGETPNSVLGGVDGDVILNGSNPASNSDGYFSSAIEFSDTSNGGCVTATFAEGDVNTAPGEYNTISFWIKWNGTGSGFIFNSKSDSMNDWYGLDVDSSGRVGFTTGCSDFLATDVSLVANEWTHISAVFYNGTPSADTCSLYLNGVKQTLTSYGNVPQERSMQRTIYIGAPSIDASYSYRFNGLIDEAKIYKGALSHEKIVAMDDQQGITYYEYDALGRIINEKLNDSPQCVPIKSYGYDDYGQLIEVADANGNVTYYDYDKRGRVAKETLPDPDGSGPATLPAPETCYTYDAAGRVLAATDVAGNVTSYDYDELDRIVKETFPDPDGDGPQNAPVTIYSYDANGNLLSTTDARANSGEYGPDSMPSENMVAYWNLDTDMDNSVDGETALTSGGMSTVVWENGRFGESLAFDGVDDYAAATVSNINTTSGEYNTVSFWMKWNGSDRQMPFSWGDSSDPHFDLYLKNGYIGFNTGQSDILGVSSEGLANRWVHIVAMFCNDTTDNSKLYIDGKLMSLDHVGSEKNPTQDRHASNTIRLSSWNGTNPEYYYFAGLIDDLRIYNTELSNSEVAALAALRGTTRFVYDSLGRVVQEIGSPIAKADGTFEMPSVEYAYDDVGNVISVKDELDRITEYYYDSLKHLVKKVMPKPIDTDSSPVYYYGYDAAGNLVWETDPLGTAPVDGVPNAEHTTFYSYDTHNRIEEEIYADPNQNYSNDSTSSKSYSYDANGNLVSITDANDNIISFKYDSLNNQVMVVFPDSDSSNPLTTETTIKYTYDAVGNLRTTTDQLGNTTVQEYDALNRLVKELFPILDSTDPSLQPIYTYTYDDSGNLESFTDALEVVTNYEYDNLGRLIHEIMPDPDLNDGDSARPTVTYSYDVVGNLLKTTDPMGNSTCYRYDTLNRQTHVISALSSDPDEPSPNNSIIMEYDLVGNVTKIIDQENRTTEYVYDDLNRLVTMILPDPNPSLPEDSTPVYHYGYDAVGNLIWETDPLARLLILLQVIRVNITPHFMNMTT